MSQHNGYDDLQTHIPELETPRNLRPGENQYSHRDYTIEITNLEFTAVCPKQDYQISPQSVLPMFQINTASN